MPKIQAIHAREILNCQGRPTIETTVVLEDGVVGTFSVPKGTSVGKYEAFELRDGDVKRFRGEGVLKAVANVNEKIGPRLLGQEASKQQDIDTMMVILDSTQDKKNLGANSILSVSGAVARAAAISLRLPLYSYLSTYVIGNKNPAQKIPAPLFNFINGGSHGVDNLDFQEFLLIPASSKSIHETMEISGNIYLTLRELLISRNASYALGDEGGFTPSFFTNVDGIAILSDAAREAGYRIGVDIFLGLDAAAISFKQEGGYKLKDRPNPFSKEELLEYYASLRQNFNLLYLEDPFDEDDWEGFAQITSRMSETTYIVGDDLTATNPKRVEEALKKKAINSVVIKPNQIGTVSEAVHVALASKKAGLKIIVSHRSGETNDSFIADLAIAVEADYVKFGAPARGERIAKYNRLLEIEEELFNAK